jgi:hypothetical protein
MPANNSLGDLVVTSGRKWRLGQTDNITNHIPLLRAIKKKGGWKEVTDSGRTIVETLIYGTNPSASYYSGFDPFTPPINQEAVDGAEYAWKQAGAFVTISGLEKIQNGSGERRISLVQARLKQAEATLMNLLGSGCYAVGTGSAGKELGGLRLLVADNPAAAGTVGGIDQVANPFWRNRTRTSAAVVSAANVQSELLAMWLLTERGADKVDTILMDDDWYTAYIGSLQALARYTDAEEVDAGFGGGVRYRNALAFYDDQCPDKRCYFVNSNHIKLAYAKGRFIDPESEMRQVPNADYETMPIWFAGNFTTSRRASHGVLISP